MTAKMLPVVILAGGLATRLRPLTETIPKALVDVNGEPLLAHQLRLLRANGIARVIICAGYLGEMIQEYAGDGGRFGLRVDFVFDGPRLLGTAGTIKSVAGTEDCLLGRPRLLKIPVTNTCEESLVELIRDLTQVGIKLNVTALLTLDQVCDVSAALAGGAPACISVFAGRIADTRRDPLPLMNDEPSFSS